MYMKVDFVRVASLAVPLLCSQEYYALIKFKFSMANFDLKGDISIYRRHIPRHGLTTIGSMRIISDSKRILKDLKREGLVS